MTLFSLEKALALLIMPTGLVWLLLLAAAWACLRRRQGWPAVLVLAGTVLYTCAGNIYLADALMARLERPVALVAVAALQPFDAVFVLGGGTEQDAAGEPELGPGGDRVFLAARLWRAGKARLLVTSGASADGVGGPRDAGQETRTLWRGVGIPDSAILPVPEPCWNTRDEIKAYTRLQAQYGWKRMGLVSSASHLPRAMALADKAGLRVTPLGADRVGRGHLFQIHMLIPQGNGFQNSQRFCWEVVGRWLGR